MRGKSCKYRKASDESPRQKEKVGLELARAISKCGRSGVAIMMTEGFATQPWNNSCLQDGQNEEGDSASIQRRSVYFVPDSIEYWQHDVRVLTLRNLPEDDTDRCEYQVCHESDDRSASGDVDEVFTGEWHEQKSRENELC